MPLRPLARSRECWRRAALAGVLLALGSAWSGCTVEESGCWYEQTDEPLDPLLCTWQRHSQNPLLQPPDTQWIIADPTLLRPDEAPDGRWHLFANALFGLYHHVSDDGVSWQLPDPLADFGPFARRPFVLAHQGRFYLFYENFKDFGGNSELLVRSSTDLASWSKPTTLLTPTLSWEMESTNTVGNPYVTVREDGVWLYYSASGVWWDDLGFHEPKYVGVARADGVLGPYTRDPQPLLGPDLTATPKILGAGSFKMLDDRVGGRLIAAQNTMYQDALGKTRSAIRLLSSPDGRDWEPVCSQPILAPTGDGWESALVYAFDTVREGDSVRLYYNARESWDFDAKERIGMATLQLPCTR